MTREETMAMLQGPPMQFRADNPYPEYHKLRKENPVFRVSPMQWIVTDYNYATTLLQSPAISHWGQDPETQSMLFSGQGEMAKTLFAFAPDSGLPYRKNVLHGLAAKSLKFEADTMKAHARKIIEELSSKDEIDFMADYAHPFTFDTICTIIGIPQEEIPALSTIVGNLLKEGGYLQFVTNPASTTAGIEFMSFLKYLIQHKQKHPGEDLCSALINSAQQEEEKESFILSMLILLLYAGHDNMMNFLGNAVFGLEQFKEEQQVLRESEQMVHSSLDELLRYDSPVQFFLLFAKEKIELGTKKVPAGSQLLVSIGAANRDPQVFPEPDKIILDRNPSHLSYGAGAYRCIGARLAQLQGSTGMSEFLSGTKQYQTIKEGVTWRRYPFVQRGPSLLKMKVKWA